MVILTLCWYFIAFSFLGWVADGIRTLFTERKFHNRGFLTSPFCPAYGASVVVLYVALHRFTSNKLLLFVLSTVLLSALFIIVGFISSKILHFKPWDFSKNRFHIGSYMTIPYALLLGLTGMLIVALLCPVLKTIIDHIPFKISVCIVLCFAAFLLFDCIFSFITYFRLRKKIKELSEDAAVLNEDVTQEKMDEIRENYNKLFTQNVLRRRLSSAFPDLKKRVYIREFADKLEEVKNENMKEYSTVYENNNDKPFAFGLCFTKLFYLFLIGSLVGTLIETVWALFVEGHFEFRVGMVYGPFIPVYGGGACFLTLVLYKLYKLNDTLIFIISAIIGAGFEYVCSWLQETIFGTVSWDYSNTPFNLNGRTNLMYALIWGLLGLIWVRYLYPWASKLIEKIPKRAGSIITTFLVIFMLIDVVMSVSAVWRWGKRDDGVQAQNNFERYIDRHFNDEKMNLLFPHMNERNNSEDDIVKEASKVITDTTEPYTTANEYYTTTIN